MLKWFKKKTAHRARDRISADSGFASQQEHFKTQGDEYAKAARYADAEQAYRQIAESDPQYPAALIMLGFVLKEQGRSSEAREVLEHAIRVTGGDADSHYLLAGIIARSGQREAEVSHLQEAISLRPDFDLARKQLLVALFDLERWAEVAELCEEGLAAPPGSTAVDFYRNHLISAQRSLSQLLFDAEQFHQSEISYRREIELTPDHFGPHHQLGVVLSRLGRHAEAIEEFKHAVVLNPGSGASYSSLAAAYIDQDQTSEQNLALARASYEKAVAVEPGNSDLHYNLGVSYRTWAKINLAMASFDRAIELDPNNAKARWARAMLWAPAFSSQGADGSSPDRSGFRSELAKFENWWIGSESDGSTFVGEAQPFFLTYQEENNLDLLKPYGRICALAMRRWLDHQKSPDFKRPVEKRIRIGIVSAEIRQHSVWIALVKGWLLSFDRARFEVVVFSLSDRKDSETAWAQGHSDLFVGGPRTLARWVDTMREQNCEVLLYPSVGLHPLTLKLASLRLAPVQINTWGHPETSGLPTLDYYLSAEYLEPIDAQAHYAERLMLLPHLGNRIQPLTFASRDPGYAGLNIDLEKPILVCPGMPFKYQPAHDQVFVEVARQLPAAQLVFFRPSAGALSDVFEDRIAGVFEAAGLNVKNHVHFIRWLDADEFHALLRRATVMLDTIGFSGYNTAVQAIECGLPLVTREGRFLRGRLASGVLRRMGLNALIAQTKLEYVNLVVRLVVDPSYRSHIRQEIQQRKSVLFDDQSAMGPFQDFVESVARQLVDPRA